MRLRSSTHRKKVDYTPYPTTRRTANARAGKNPKTSLRNENSAPDTKYEYEPLDRSHDSHQIRLIRLLPASNLEDEVHCELFHASLDEKPKYEAVSYAWGDPKVTAPIQLHSHQHSVTTNLATALRYFRLAKEARILWVDALCINQIDISEKNHRVANMRRIYLQAITVLVWLGEEGNARKAIDFAQLGLGKALKSMPKSKYFEALTAFEELFHQRSWWKRLWILQEVCHGNSVVAFIGKFQVDFDTMCEKWYHEFKLATMVEDSTDYSCTQYISWMRNINFVDQPIDRILRIRRNSTGGLLNLLIMTRDHEAGDPRDKIFGILGMSDSQIKPNYNISLREVYKDATRKALCIQSLHILLMVESMERSILSTEFPSWVPDYSKKQRIAASFIFMNFRRFEDSIGTDKFDLENQIITPFNEKMSEVLSVVGLYAAVITDVLPFEVAVPTLAVGIQDERLLKLFKYEQDPAKMRNFSKGTDRQYWDHSTTNLTPQNTSWGPYEAEVGDVVILINAVDYH